MINVNCFLEHNDFNVYVWTQPFKNILDIYDIVRKLFKDEPGLVKESYWVTIVMAIRILEIEIKIVNEMPKFSDRLHMFQKCQIHVKGNVLVKTSKVNITLEC